MQGALERTEQNQYHLFNVDGAGDDITELARVPHRTSSVPFGMFLLASFCLQWDFTLCRTGRTTCLRIAKEKLRRGLLD